MGGKEKQRPASNRRVVITARLHSHGDDTRQQRPGLASIGIVVFGFGSNPGGANAECLQPIKTLQLSSIAELIIGATSSNVTTVRSLFRRLSVVCPGKREAHDTGGTS